MELNSVWLVWGFSVDDKWVERVFITEGSALSYTASKAKDLPDNWFYEIEREELYA